MTDVTEFLLAYGGPVLFAIVFVEQAGLPLPAAPWLLAAGALSATGRLSPALAIGVTALGAVMADSIWFFVGRRGGQRVLSMFCRLSLSCTSCIGRTENLFTRHGLHALVAAKFLPGLGAVMPPLAGALGMSTRRFLLFDGLGSLIYGSFYIAAGFLFHDQLGKAISWLSRLGFGAVLLGLVLISGYLVFKYFQRRKPVVSGIGHQNAGMPRDAAVETASELPGSNSHFVTAEPTHRAEPAFTISSVASSTVAGGLWPAVEPGILPCGPGEGQYQLAKSISSE